MPKSMPNPEPGSFVHVEFVSDDPAATQKFYEKAFGWKFEVLGEDMGNYRMFEAGNGPAGGIRAPMQKGEAPSTVTYINVADLDASIRTCTKAGGKQLMPKTEVPGKGWMAVFQIPGGPIQGIWQAA